MVVPEPAQLDRPRATIGEAIALRHPLIDYRAINAEHPECYPGLPVPEAIKALRVGDIVKIGVAPPVQIACPEHFWVKVVATIGGLVGSIANDLQPALGLRYGDVVRFSAENIRMITPDPPSGT